MCRVAAKNGNACDGNVVEFREPGNLAQNPKRVIDNLTGELAGAHDRYRREKVAIRCRRAENSPTVMGAGDLTNAYSERRWCLRRKMQKTRLR
jgi:hypothetical protein